MDVFDLTAKINLDAKQFKAGLDGVKGQLNKLTGPVTQGLATVGKAAGVAIAGAATGVAVITKQAVSAFGTFEQLEGGTKLLFGDASKYIIEKSEEAFNTVQMSQNDYLQQVNGFAVGLKTALGGNERAAAELADKIITAEADVVAATGNTQEAVQNAFNGIMKGNYMMLDNLQLGIKPTKEGFQEVIDKVNEWHAAQGDATKYTIDNLADCEAALVDYIKMQGLAGYASNEASETIQGSIAAMKGAWTNLVAGLAKPDADIGKLITNFVNAAEKALDNLAPAVERALSAISEVIAKAAPIIAKALPKLIKQLLPVLIKAAVDLVAELIKALPEILKALVDAIPDILEELFGAMESVLPKSLTPVLESIKNAIMGIVNWLSNLDEKQINTIKTIIEIVAAIAGVLVILNTLISVISAVSGAIAFLTSPIGLVIIAIAALVAIGILLYKNWDKIKEAAAALRDAIVQAWDNMKDKVVTAIQDLKNSTIAGWQQTKDEAVAAWENIKNSVSDAAQQLRDNVVNAIENLKSRASAIISQIKQKFEDLKNRIQTIAQQIKNAFNFNFSMPHIKMPHLKITYTTADSVVAKFLGISQIPHFSVEWYKKAYDNPFMFTKPTLMGFGDGNGGEMVYGHDNLMRDIRAASGNPEVQARLDRLISLLEDIAYNGLNANIDSRSIYKAVKNVNATRTRATNYNGLSMA